jgi:hypothetical protein
VLSGEESHDGQAKNKVRVPWDEEQIERDPEDWTDDIIMMPQLGIVLNEDDCWACGTTKMACRCFKFADITQQASPLRAGAQLAVLLFPFTNQ